jgi:hypothetical protein
MARVPKFNGMELFDITVRQLPSLPFSFWVSIQADFPAHRNPAGSACNVRGDDLRKRMHIFSCTITACTITAGDGTAKMAHSDPKEI